MDIWLVRHGETEWSRSGRHTSVTDLPLTETGADQARAVTPLLVGTTFEAVLCSPRLRALQTADLASASGHARDGAVHVDPDLAEWDYGDYEGLTSPQIHEQASGWTIFGDGAPGGESPAEISARVGRVIDRCLDVAEGDPSGSAAQCLLIAHGHVLRALATAWVEQPLDLGNHLDLDTATVSILGFDRGTRVIHRWNDPD